MTAALNETASLAQPVSLLALVRAIRAGELTPLAAFDRLATRAAAVEPSILAFAAENWEAARKTVEARAERPLAGLPVGLKDIVDTSFLPTEYGSRVYAGHQPAGDAALVGLLAEAGATFPVKTTTTEFAHMEPTETRNPWAPARSPGGSSSGSAAAVAAGMLPAATGSQTGGSTVRPGSFCGIVGMKPTYGRCSRWGIVAFASSLDQAGPIARNVRDAAIMLRSMASADAKDTTSVDRPVPDYEAALTGDVRGLKVGIPKEYRVEGMSAEIDALWQQGIDWLKAQGAEIREVSLPHTKYALPAYYIVAPAEASSNLARYDGVRYGLRVNGDDITGMYENTRAAGFGAEVKRRVLIGTYVLSAGYYDAYYLKAQKVRTLIKRDFEQAFEDVDVLLTPTTPTPAFAPGEITDPVEMYLNDVFTVTVNMAGLPGISVPAGLSADGLPLGLQLIGKAFDEETLFRAGGALEEAAGFAARPDAWWTV